MEESAAPLERLRSLEGVEIGPGRWVTVTQQGIDSFADATGDHQWIHVDRDRAERESPFGGTVAHGMLTLSLVPGLALELLDAGAAGLMINYGFDRVRFSAPVAAGSRVRLHLSVASTEAVGAALRISLDATVEVEGGAKPACVARLILQAYP